MLLIIAVGFSAALGIFMYRFYKTNIVFIPVGGKNDPSLDTRPEILFPETAGDFQRTSELDRWENISGMADMNTSSSHVAVYEDASSNSISVVAVPTAEANEQRDRGIGVLTMGRGKANSSDTGISIRYPFSGDAPQTVVAWSKPNWTFMVQTTSTLSGIFVENFAPGGVANVDPVGDSSVAEATAVPTEMPTTGTVAIVPSETEYN